MKNPLLVVLISLFLLSACSSNDPIDSFKRSSWGDTVDDVIEEEEERENTNYEEEDEDNLGFMVKHLTFKNITIKQQEILLVDYQFTEEVDGEKQDEPVLEAILFMFPLGEFDEEAVEKVSDYLNKQYGEPEVEPLESRPGASRLKWHTGDTYIVFEEYTLLSYRRKPQD